MDEARPLEKLQEPTAAMVEAVDVLRAGLSEFGLDELAARLSTAFWSMRRADQSAVLAEAAAELRRVALTSPPEHASAPDASPNLCAPEGFHYFFELEGFVGTDRRLSVGFTDEYIGADRRLLDGFADAHHWLLNGHITEATQGLTSIAEGVLCMPQQSLDCQGPTSWADGEPSRDCPVSVDLASRRRPDLRTCQIH